MKKRLVSGGVAVLFLVGTGCSRLLGSEDEEPTLDLIDVGWVLTSFQQANGVHKDVGSQGMSLTFLENGRLEGLLYTLADPESPGIAYFATYEAGLDGTMSIAPPAFSEHPGFFPHGSRWFEYHRALSNATTYEIEQDRLRINYDEGWGLHFRVNPDGGSD